MKILQLQKRSSGEYQSIQDKFAYSESKRIIALADGTTQSYRSDLWAELVTTSFIENPTFDSEALIGLLKDCAIEFRNTQSTTDASPAVQALLRDKQKQGGTATFLALRLTEEGNAEIISCGDTNVFIVRTGRIVDSFPFAWPEGLDENQYFLNSEKVLLGEIDASFFQKKTIQLKNKDTVILATDAISRLLLNDQLVVPELLGITSFDQFLEWSTTQWNKKSLQEDDLTCIMFSEGVLSPINLFIPYENFRFDMEHRPKSPVKEGVKPRDLEGTPGGELKSDTESDSREVNDSSAPNKEPMKTRNVSYLLVGLVALVLLDLYCTSRLGHQVDEIRETAAVRADVQQAEKEMTLRLNEVAVRVDNLYKGLQSLPGQSIVGADSFLNNSPATQILSAERVNQVPDHSRESKIEMAEDSLTSTGKPITQDTSVQGR